MFNEPREPLVIKYNCFVALEGIEPNLSNAANLVLELEGNFYSCYLRVNVKDIVGQILCW